MTELRFPGCLNWEIHVDEKCRNASVFPIILLMFTENTIKHNMIMGEELRVRITGSLVERNGEKYVVLTHLDSGSGYFEEDLEYLNRPVSQQVQRVRFHTFHTGRMAIRRKAKLKHRNLFFHMLPTHLRSPAKETRAKACLKKAFGLLFVTIQIHAKRKKGTGLLQ